MLYDEGAAMEQALDQSAMNAYKPSQHQVQRLIFGSLKAGGCLPPAFCLCLSQKETL